MGHEPELIPNFTFFIQLGLFLGSFLVLKTLVFGPYLRLIHKRQQRTEGLRARAQQQREKAEQLRIQYESFMKTERMKVAQWVEEERKKIAEEERKILQDARDVVGGELRALREKTTAEVEKSRKSLLPSVGEYASQIASQLLGRKVIISGVGTEAKKGARIEQTVPG